MMNKTCLITGISGMDGSHMADFLLEKGYKVYGFIRRSSSANLWRIEHIINRIELIEGDLGDQSSLDRAIGGIKPDEIYNFASQSFVQHSFKAPLYTADVTGLGALRVFESVRNFSPSSRVYQASSSEMFGEVQETPQTEQTPFQPRSPYGIAKTFAHYSARVYRQAYGLYIANGIAFNHESERRGEEFLSRKVTRGVARIKSGLTDKLKLGNLKAKRDWGYAPDYIEGFWALLQLDQPEDVIFSTGKSYSVKEFVEKAFEYAELNWQKYVEYDQNCIRPAEVNYLCGDNSRAWKLLGWKPKTTFEGMVKKMVDSDVAQLCNNSKG